ncbi:hypothetical protein HYW55_05585 [Candidatus Gottesmanbacteria bacterium]|nr:hypothetical protein [Candidatus Gottesmanbacteria bacterium]
MCFTIPARVLKSSHNLVTVEGGKTVLLGNDLTVKKGEYVQVVGNMAVGKLSSHEGLRIRKLIRSLNQ